MEFNYTTAVFLISDKVRGINCSYEIDADGKPVKIYTFKTFDDGLRPGDLVVVPTDTRHKFTVVRVEEVDVEVDVESRIEMKWIAGKFEPASYERVLHDEQAMVAKVKEAKKEARRRELKDELLATMSEEDRAKLLLSGPSDETLTPPPGPPPGEDDDEEDDEDPI